MKCGGEVGVGHVRKGKGVDVRKGIDGGGTAHGGRWLSTPCEPGVTKDGSGACSRVRSEAYMP